MRSKFDAQLRELGEKLTLMGAMCEESCKQKSIAEMKKVPQNLHS